MEKELDRQPVYNKECLKTKIKSHDDEVTDSYDKEIPIVDSNHTCLTIDFALKEDANYYLQAFLKES